jgi:hypothetical protein
MIVMLTNLACSDDNPIQARMCRILDAQAAALLQKEPDIEGEAPHNRHRPAQDQRSDGA